MNKPHLSNLTIYSNSEASNLIIHSYVKKLKGSEKNQDVSNHIFMKNELRMFFVRKPDLLAMLQFLCNDLLRQIYVI